MTFYRIEYRLVNTFDFIAMASFDTTDKKEMLARKWRMEQQPVNRLTEFRILKCEVIES